MCGGRRGEGSILLPMRVRVNGDIMEFEGERASVSDLLTLLERRGTPVGRACAVEVNRALAPRKNHQTTMLRDGDEVEIVTLVGGG